MSSFRIDRQYVSFETAETEPVYATPKPQKAKPAPVEDTKPFGGDISKLYNEIYERLQSEHAEQAEFMLSKAADEAQEMIDKALKQADEILCQANSDAVKMREELLGGIQAEAEEKKCRAEAELLAMETKLQSDYSQLISGMHGDVIALVMEIVRKIIGIKLSQSDEIFTGVIKDALERLKQTGTVLIRVSPIDYARYFGSERGDVGNGSILETLDTGEMKITAVEEPNFSEGDLIVESEGEMIDLGINRQIDLIEKAFLN